MEIDSTDMARELVETNVVEPFKACAVNILDPVIRHQKLFLPSHENVVPLGKVPVAEIRALCLFGERSPRWESSPVLHIHFIIRTPLCMSCLERVFCADYLSFEECGKRWVLMRETLDAEIAAEVRLAHIHMFDVHLNIIHLTIGLLGAFEATAGTEERGGGVGKKLAGRVSGSQRVTHDRVAYSCPRPRGYDR